MKKDLVCGMEVDEERAAFKAGYAGVSYYFCSLRCQESFRRLATVFSKDAIDSMTPTQYMEPQGGHDATQSTPP